MAQATFHFPRGFLWGVATAAHQVEGNSTNSDWWAWEQIPGHIQQGHKSGLANDWWSGRWREDFDRADELNLNAFRLSVEWSRIQPTPDHWDESALERYREMVRGLQARNMAPLVTLHHFSLPRWVSERGGFASPTIVDLFVRFVEKVVDALKEYVTLWVTINEPSGLAIHGYLWGLWPPGEQSLGAAFRVMENLARCHGAAYHVIHKIQPHARVGISQYYRGLTPARSWFPPDRWVTGALDRYVNDLLPRAFSTGVLRLPGGRKTIPDLKGTQDFIGIDYYTREQVTFDPLKPGELFARRSFSPGADLSDTGYLANDPGGMFQALQWAHGFNLPIIITENGVENADDTLRPRYLVQHLHQVWRAVNFNYPVKGYFHWTLVDNFEWERGWTQRFGLWELDVATQARRKRRSADLYAEIAKENGISSEMVAKYAPELLPQMFPDE